MSKSVLLATIGFYALIGFTASALLFLAFYWSLRLNASISNLIQSFWDMPLYFWPYAVLALGTIVLFGAGVALFSIVGESLDLLLEVFAKEELQPASPL